MTTDHSLNYVGYRTRFTVEEALTNWRRADDELVEASIAERDAFLTRDYREARTETDLCARHAARSARYLIATLLDALGVVVEPLDAEVEVESPV